MITKPFTIEASEALAHYPELQRKAIARVAGSHAQEHSLPYVTIDDVDLAVSERVDQLQGETAMNTQYRKGTFEARMNELLPDYPSYSVIAHELWRDDGSWSVNDSWFLSRGCDREEAISHLRSRWEVFKVNYAPKARVQDLTDANHGGDEFPSLLEVDCIPFAEVRNADKE